MSWTTDAASFCSITPDVGQGPVNGICKVTPDKDTTYILIAFGDNGPAEKLKKVCIMPPSINILRRCMDQVPAVKCGVQVLMVTGLSAPDVCHGTEFI